MAQQLLPSGGVGKHPVVELEDAPPCAKLLIEERFASTVVQHLFGLEVGHQLSHIVGIAFARKKFACRDVEEGYAHALPTEVYGRQKVVLFIVEHVVGHGHAWRHQFGNATFHQLLCELRVFQLVADGHTASSAYEAG